MRQEVYRVAFDEASAELSEILAKFEQLRSRKDRIEKVVEALKPLVALESPAPVVERSAAPQTAPSEGPGHSLSEAGQATTPSPIPYPMQQPASDPFSRRIETAVGSGNSAKDVSEYSRLFNTGVTRGS